MCVGPARRAVPLLTFHVDGKEAPEQDVAGQRDLVRELPDPIDEILVVVGAGGAAHRLGGLICVGLGAGLGLAAGAGAEERVEDGAGERAPPTLMINRGPEIVGPLLAAPRPSGGACRF